MKPNLKTISGGIALVATCLSLSNCVVPYGEPGRDRSNNPHHMSRDDDHRGPRNDNDHRRDDDHRRDTGSKPGSGQWTPKKNY